MGHSLLSTGLIALGAFVLMEFSPRGFTQYISSQGAYNLGFFCRKGIMSGEGGGGGWTFWGAFVQGACDLTPMYIYYDVFIIFNLYVYPIIQRLL